MQKRFLDQVAVVTGASTGIGYEIAKMLISEGAKRVYITGRTSSTLEKASSRLGEKAIHFVSDVSSLSDLKKLKTKIESIDNHLDIIVANAGIAENNIFGATNEEKYDKIFDINVKGVFFTVQTLLPLLKDGATVLLIASIVANKGMPNLSLYNASKAAVRSFARSWANDLKQRKIRVNALSPGLTRTPIQENGLKMDQEQIKALQEYAKEAVPSGYVAQAEEIAAAALFLVSDQASYVNGVEFSVDGGLAQI
jgi:NAD(P)-dependent dehydrogenase (short-subunit alcohol dehydrogenase family)